MTRRLRAVAGASLALALLAAGCGTGGPVRNGDTSRGRQLFINGANGKQACGSCHVLAAAGTNGTLGPNLDYAFAGPRKQGFKESTIEQVVVDQIRLAACVEPGTPFKAPDQKTAALVEAGDCMPRNLLTGKDAVDVAAYVASVAGNPAAAAAGKITATTGPGIFQAAACASCHTLSATKATGKVGPDLDRLAAEAARAHQALEAFVRASIVSPDAYVEPGYQKGVMPSNFGQLLSKTQLDTLVKFLVQAAKRR